MVGDGHPSSTPPNIELVFRSRERWLHFGGVRGNGKARVELLAHDVAKWVNVKSVAIVRISAFELLTAE